jgi:hypothetical protein
VHFSDERDCVGDAFVPSRLSPGVFASLLALGVRRVAPNVVDVVETADLREEPGVGFVVVASVVDGACPVVAPLDHGAGFEAVGAHFVDVVATARFHHRPVAEGEEILQVAGAQESAAFCRELHVVLKTIPVRITGKHRKVNELTGSFFSSRSAKSTFSKPPV